MHFSTLLTLSLATIALAYPIIRDEVVSPHAGNIDVDKTRGSLDDLITRNLAEHENLPTLSSRVKDIIEHSQIVKRGEGTSWRSETLTKAEIEALKQYLSKMPLNGVEKAYGTGKYVPWHGDSKSQVDVPKTKGKSAKKTASAYQTKSMLTSTDPAVYRTIVAGKGQSHAFITYEAPEFEGADVIVKALLEAL